jgi:Transposase DDE domain
MHELKMIELYCYICDQYNEYLRWNVQRFSNNGFTGDFTDAEIITIYLYCMAYEEKYQVKTMHKHIEKYWYSWFPKLPSYQAFNSRLNRLSDALSHLVNLQMQSFYLSQDTIPILLGDSFPIITCSHKRKPKVALNLIDKGFCATKNLHYFGLKLHALGLKRTNTLPFPQFLDVTPASVHDLTALKPVLQNTYKQAIVLDKAYCSAELQQNMSQNDCQLITPIKEKKGIPDVIKKIDHAFNDRFNYSVSVIRQPIESLFNWLNQLTQLQNASKVRSKTGLIVHVFGRLATALWCLTNF